MSEVKVELVAIGLKDNGDGTLNVLFGVRSPGDEKISDRAHVSKRIAAFYGEDGKAQIVTMEDGEEMPENIKNAPKVPFETVKAFLEGRTE
jgi:hypothetical protein